MEQQRLLSPDFRVTDRGCLVVKVTALFEFKPYTAETRPMHAKYVEAQTSSCWCGLEVRRGVPRHSTVAQKCGIHRQKPLSS
ncbi:hypothetical protein TNCV_2535661 [Trichonephila clavipes]|nr:hypothetical protein TNCV_2535661 [Trichonephila clavipes]